MKVGRFLTAIAAIVFTLLSFSNVSAQQSPAATIPAGMWGVSSVSILCDGTVSVSIANPGMIEDGDAVTLNIYIGNSMTAGTTTLLTPGVGDYSETFDTSGWFAGFDVKVMVYKAGSVTMEAEAILDTECSATTPPATQEPTEPTTSDPATPIVTTPSDSAKPDTTTSPNAPVSALPKTGTGSNDNGLGVTLIVGALGLVLMATATRVRQASRNR